MANKTLTARVKLETKSAEAGLTRLSKKINNVQKAVNRTTGNNNKLTNAINRSVTATNRLNQATRRVADTTDRVSDKARKISSANNQATSSANNLASAYQSSNSFASGLLTTLKRIATTYLGIMGLRALVGTTDTIIGAENKLNYVNSQQLGVSASSDEALQATQESLDKMYASAQKVRMAYTDMISNVSKSMVLAGSAFKDNTDNAIRFQEIMAEAYAIGGASASEMSTSMYQMIQALGAGVLAGDELRSVREGAPLAYQAIEKFVQGVYDTEESLKELASQGLVTSDMVVAAILDSGDRIDEAFSHTKQTFAQTWTQIKNLATKAFTPVADTLKTMLNDAVNNGLLGKLQSFFTNVSKGIQIVVQVVRNAINWIADNWSWLQQIIASGIITLTLLMVASAVISIIAWIAANWVILLVVAAIFAVIYVLHLLGFTTSEIVGFICGAFMFLAYLIWDIIVWIVTIVYWAAALIWDAIVSVVVVIINLIIAIVTIVLLAVQIILQLVMWLITTIWAILVTIYNVIYTIVKTVVAVVKGAIVGIYQLFVWLAQGILWILYGLASVIDFIFGSNLSDSVKGWIDDLGASVDSLNDALDPLGEFEDIGAQWSVSYGELGDMYAGNGEYDDWNITDNMGNLINGSMSLMGEVGETGVDLMLDPTMLNDWAIDNTLNPLDGWDSGYEFGTKITNLDALGDMLGLDFTDVNFNTDNLLNTSPIEDLLGGIGEDVGDISDSLDLTDDDLEYLRKLAEMEWRKEFTTAEIKVDMTNNNTVNGDRDLDGIVEYLANTLREEMTNVADGVHY